MINIMENKHEKIDIIIKYASIIGPVFIILLLSCSPGVSFEEDLGRHILLGKITVETLSVPDTNLLTHTHPDYPFVNHHWFSEVLLYLIHKMFGFNGLIIWKMIIMTLCFFIALRTITKGQNHLLIWFSGLLAAMILGARTHIRPELITFLCVALYSLFIEKLRNNETWPRWAVFPVALFWANCHIYFIFGVGMLGAFALEQMLISKDKRTVRYEMTWIAGIILISCINPSTYEGFLFPFKIFSNYAIDVIENKSTFYFLSGSYNPMLISIPIMALIVIIASIATVIKNIKDRTFIHTATIIIALTALLATQKMIRSAPLLSLTGMIIIAQAPIPCIINPKIKIMGAVIVLLLNVLICYSIIEGSYFRVFPNPMKPQPRGFADETRFNRLREIDKKYGIPENIFNDYNGSLIEYELYPKKSYADNRPEAFPGEFWRAECSPAFMLGKEWDLVVEKRNIQTVIAAITAVSQVFIRELINSPKWVLIHLDDLHAVFVKNVPQNATIIKGLAFTQQRIEAHVKHISKLLMDLPQVPWYKRQVAVSDISFYMHGVNVIGKENLIWPYIYQFYKLYPDFESIHEMMVASAPPYAIPELETIISQKAKWPLGIHKVMRWGSHLIAKNRRDEALQVYKRARFFFPFSAEIRSAIDQINDEIYLENVLKKSGFEKNNIGGIEK
ncbi:conserved hypothetical protein, membrane [Candidatus Magnetomorum sp. HK-1]|nr:conserved hypothetical protein, membrane [Candidatus Magnetomorum sp. HK-1]